jgi:hypothetical protein
MTREQFTDEFRYLYSSSGMPLDAVAAVMKTSRLTISRWFEGVSAPHEVGRSSVIEAMKRLQPNTTEEKRLSAQHHRRKPR